MAGCIWRYLKINQSNQWPEEFLLKTKLQLNSLRWVFSLWSAMKSRMTFSSALVVILGDWKTGNHLVSPNISLFPSEDSRLTPRHFLSPRFVFISYILVVLTGAAAWKNRSLHTRRMWHLYTLVYCRCKLYFRYVYYTCTCTAFSLKLLRSFFKLQHTTCPKFKYSKLDGETFMLLMVEILHQLV